MKNKIPPKYRAKHFYSDKLIYGNLFQGRLATFIYGADFYSRVDPKTLQKLSGYDKDGNEVYRTYKLK